MSNKSFNRRPVCKTNMDVLTTFVKSGDTYYVSKFIAHMLAVIPKLPNRSVAIQQFLKSPAWERIPEVDDETL